MAGTRKGRAAMAPPPPLNRRQSGVLVGPRPWHWTGWGGVRVPVPSTIHIWMGGKPLGRANAHPAMGSDRPHPAIHGCHMIPCYGCGGTATIRVACLPGPRRRDTPPPASWEPQRNCVFFAMAYVPNMHAFGHATLFPKHKEPIHTEQTGFKFLLGPSTEGRARPSVSSTPAPMPSASPQGALALAARRPARCPPLRRCPTPPAPVPRRACSATPTFLSRRCPPALH